MRPTLIFLYLTSLLSYGLADDLTGYATATSRVTFPDTFGPSTRTTPAESASPGETEEPEASSTPTESSVDEPSNTDEASNTDKPSNADEPSETEQPSETDEPNGNSSTAPEPTNPPFRGWATSYDLVANPAYMHDCAIPHLSNSKACRKPLCGESPIYWPSNPPNNTGCSIELAGIIRIPDTINDETSFARIDYASSSHGKESCRPQLSRWDKLEDGIADKWVYDVCGTEMEISRRPDQIVVVGSKDGLIKASGVLETKVSESRVRNCCQNFRRYHDIPDWPFCGYTDYAFEGCWSDEEVGRMLTPV